MEDVMLMGKYKIAKPPMKVRVMLYEDLQYVDWLLENTRFQLTGQAAKEYNKLKGIDEKKLPF